MATKRIKSPGNNYWDTAAKQFPWPIDHNDKQILVPQEDLELAEAELITI